MAGYEHSPRAADIERSLPQITRLADDAGLGAEVHSLVEMLDRRDRDLEQRHLNPPSVRVGRTTNHIIGSATLNRLAFNVVRWDSTNGGMWQITPGFTDQLYAPIDGVYAVGIHIECDAVSYGLYIASNGVYHAEDTPYGQVPGRSLSTEIALKAGESAYFELYNNDVGMRTAYALGRYSVEAYMTWLRPGVFSV